MGKSGEKWVVCPRPHRSAEPKTQVYALTWPLSSHFEELRPNMSDFMGEYDHSVDEKGRINVPARFRKALPPETRDTFIITLWVEGCIAGYALDEWERVKSKLRTISAMKKRARQVRRLIVSRALEVAVDKQGRITIPRAMLDKVNITDRVKMVGVLERFEIWNPDQYERTIADSEEIFDEVVEELDL